MTNKGNKRKRGQRGSLEDQQGTPKRSNIADYAVVELPADAGVVEAQLQMKTPSNQATGSLMKCSLNFKFR